MKNRTLIGILCMVVAVAIVFVVAPLVNRATNGTREHIRLAAEVAEGEQITADKLEVVTVWGDSVPVGAINAAKDIVGKYANRLLHPGEYLFDYDLALTDKTSEAAIAKLNGEKVAVTFEIQNFAAFMSKKLENGDIIRLFVEEKQENGVVKMYTPTEFQYLEVISTVTDSGIDQSEAKPDDDGNIPAAKTILAIVTPSLAKKLAYYNNHCDIYVTLVCRADNENAQAFLEKQEEINKQLAEQEAKEAEQNG